MRIIKNASAQRLSSYRGGGFVKNILIPETESEFASAYTQNSFILGGGTNTVIADGEVERPVISTKGLNELTVIGQYHLCEYGQKHLCDNKQCDRVVGQQIRPDESGQTILVGAGVPLGQVLALSSNLGVGGLEFLVGVPALIGGATHMNAGAFGAQIGDYLDEITVLTADSEIVTKKRGEYTCSYRKGPQGIILSVRLCLPNVDAKQIARKKEEYLTYRKGRQPSQPSVGSVFKRVVVNEELNCLLNGGNPNKKPLTDNESCDSASSIRALSGFVPSSRVLDDAVSNRRDSDRMLDGVDCVSAGLLIERVGLKGTRMGGAEISTVHGNFIVNVGGGSAADYVFLTELAEKRVFEQFGVKLEREFVLLR